MFASPGLHFCHVLAHAERASDERARTATSTESFMVDETSLVSDIFVMVFARDMPLIIGILFGLSSIRVVS